MKEVKTVEDLKNTKIYLSNKEDRVKFQEMVFSLGVKWNSGETEVMYLNAPFLYIDDKLILKLNEYDFGCDFINDSNKQIFLHDVLKIEPPRHGFETKESVLVRQDKVLKWNLTEYAYFDTEITHGHVCLNGQCFKYCIPYEGNEHLLGTTKDK